MTLLQKQQEIVRLSPGEMRDERIGHLPLCNRDSRSFPFSLVYRLLWFRLRGGSGEQRCRVYISGYMSESETPCLTLKPELEHSRHHKLWQ